MALIKCQECGKEISDLAGSCPNCGCPIKNIVPVEVKQKANTKNPMNKKTKTIISITIGIVFVVAMIFITIASVGIAKDRTVKNTVSEDVLKNAKTFIDVTDKYIAGDLDKKETLSRLDTLDFKTDRNYKNDLFVEIDANSIEMEISTGSMTTVREKRNALAERINYKTKK